MRFDCGIVLMLTLNVAFSVLAVNHWVLNDTGLISAKFDSPFFMQEPQNLPSFLDQVEHNEIIESTFLELLQKREQMVEQINYSIQFGMDVIDQARCALDFYDADNSLTYTRLTPQYLSRLNRKVEYELLVKSDLPHCWRYYEFKAGICCFDHLPSLGNTELLQIAPEEELKDDSLGMNDEYLLSNIVAGLEKNPKSWKYHTLGSYYWRMKGDAHEAIECARRGILLAPRKLRDIPLMSLGTILWRSEQLKDADIVLTTATDHADHIPENHLALGTTLAMLYDFNRSIEHFDMAEKLNPLYSEKISNLKNFVVCLENLNKKTVKLDNYVEYFKKEVNALRILKNKITASHERLLRQQVPLLSRYLGVDVVTREFDGRIKYCSTRTVNGAEKGGIFCDVFSDIQMRLQSKEADIEWLEREINANSEAVKKRLSLEFHTQFNLQRMKGKTRKD